MKSSGRVFSRDSGEVLKMIKITTQETAKQEMTTIIKKQIPLLSEQTKLINECTQYLKNNKKIMLGTTIKISRKILFSYVFVESHYHDDKNNEISIDNYIKRIINTINHESYHKTIFLIEEEQTERSVKTLERTHLEYPTSNHLL